MEKINYNIYLKNKDRKSATWTARIRQDGQVKDVNLKTKDREVAERWLRGAKRALEEYMDAAAEGKATKELYGRVIKINDVSAQRESQGSPVTVREAVDAYEVELRRKNYREKTIACYMRALRRMYSEDSPVSSVADTDSAMRTFDGLSSGGRHYYVSILRGFIVYCTKKYGVHPNDEIPGVRVEPIKDQRHWSVWQMRKIIENAEVRLKSGAVDEPRTEWIRIYYWLLATSGLRQGEAYEIRWGDIDWATSQVTLRESTTKTRVTRKAPLQSYVLELLARKYRAGSYSASEGVFDGRIPGQQAVRFQVLRRAIAKANEGLPVHSQIPLGGLHTFRHSLSVLLYSPDENGVRPDIKTVADILGHGPKVALQYYQSTRSPEEKKDLINSRFGGGEMRSVIDDMIEDGLI